MRAKLRSLVPDILKPPLRRLRRIYQFISFWVFKADEAPDLFHAYPYLYRHPDVQRRPGGWLYQGEFYPDYLTVGGAGHAIFAVALKHCQGRGIDVGAGLWPLPGAIPVDIWRGPGADTSVSNFQGRSLDFVFSSHCLEHIERWEEALADWVGKLVSGGTIFLYLPHPDCGIWRPGSPFVGDGHKWMPTPQAVTEALTRMGCELTEVNEGPDAMQSFYVCARRTDS